MLTIIYRFVILSTSPKAPPLEGFGEAKAGLIYHPVNTEAEFNNVCKNSSAIFIHYINAMNFYW